MDNLIEAEIGSSGALEENAGNIWNISFKLYATVAKEAKSEFEDLVGERYKARIKQAVVSRSCAFEPTSKTCAIRSSICLNET